MFNVCVFYDISLCHLCLKQHQYTIYIIIIHLNSFYEYSTAKNTTVFPFLEAILVRHRPFLVSGSQKWSEEIDWIAL